MDGFPVTIRTLDPPLHEFLPHDEEGTKKLAKKLKVKGSSLWENVQSLHEANPMLGHRGCRLAVFRKRAWPDSSASSGSTRRWLGCAATGELNQSGCAAGNGNGSGALLAFGLVGLAALFSRRRR